ncbi:MAG: TlpA disulfide reductase family protein [Pseudomonadota bacterium]
MTRRMLIPLLYLALGLTAIPAQAQQISAETLAQVTDLREGDMRKLVVHDAPKPAGDVPYLTLDGTEHTIAESNGKIRIINFWATWCAPCRHEKPALDTLNKDLNGPDFDVIAIATGRNSPEGIRKFNAELGIETLTTYLDNRSAAARRMGVLGLPVSVVIDRDGNEIARLQGGADWTSDSTRAIMDLLMAGGS